jgi:hypothetical protein
VLIALLATLAVACEPADGFKTTRVARGQSTVTEFFAGAYRVTRCDADGQPVKSTTMARIVTPTGDEPFVPIEVENDGRRVFLIYGDPDEPRWARAWLEHGADATRRAVAPSAPLPADLDIRAASLDDSCRNGAYSTFSRWPGARYSYQVNARTLSSAFRSAVIRGHHAWDRTRNNCGYGDQDNITSSYRGDFRGSIHTIPDGRSMVDFGRLDATCGSAVTLACTWTFSGADGRIVETDQRYGSTWRWSVHGSPGTYDVESAAAHETGHSIGLGHANASPYLTMYHQICAGCTRARTLARGDVRGLRALY